jgi:Tfp pilus assembly PilM family ATPase
VLVKVAIVPLLADAIVDGEIMDPHIVAEAVQGALAEAGAKTKDVVTAVGGRDVIVKKPRWSTSTPSPCTTPSRPTTRTRCAAWSG